MGMIVVRPDGPRWASGPFWGLFWVSWGPPGASWEPLGCLWRLLGASWCLLVHTGGGWLGFLLHGPPVGSLLGPSWGPLRLLWALLLLFWDSLGPSWGALGGLWGRSVAVLETSWAVCVEMPEKRQGETSLV